MSDRNRKAIQAANARAIAAMRTAHSQPIAGPVFRLYFTNLFYWSHKEATTLEGAVELAKAAGFDCGIYEQATPDANATLVATWSIIGGLTTLTGASSWRGRPAGLP